MIKFHIFYEQSEDCVEIEPQSNDQNQNGRSALDMWLLLILPDLDEDESVKNGERKYGQLELLIFEILGALR